MKISTVRVTLVAIATTASFVLTAVSSLADETTKTSICADYYSAEKQLLTIIDGILAKQAETPEISTSNTTN